MMDRLLVAETPGLIANADRIEQKWNNQGQTEWRNFSTLTTNQYYVHESTIDLGGYTRQDDLTVFFRSSFEQVGGRYTVAWFATEQNPLNGFDAAILEMVFISSVPLTDAHFEQVFLAAPGFTNFRYDPSFIPDQMHVNRTQIIHGHLQDRAVNTVTGSAAITAEGQGYMLPIVDEYFSSLEPTAADQLYVYRLIALPRPSILNSTGLTSVLIPPRRIIMDTMVDKEPELSYMMRLKRSYELANQV
jgi:hypothetical protein